MDSPSFDYSYGSYCGSNRSSGWLRRCCQWITGWNLSGTGIWKDRKFPRTCLGILWKIWNWWLCGSVSSRDWTGKQRNGTGCHADGTILLQCKSADWQCRRKHWLRNAWIVWLPDKSEVSKSEWYKRNFSCSAGVQLWKWLHRLGIKKLWLLHQRKCRDLFCKDVCGTWLQFIWWYWICTSCTSLLCDEWRNKCIQWIRQKDFRRIEEK